MDMKLSIERIFDMAQRHGVIFGEGIVTRISGNQLVKLMQEAHKLGTDAWTMKGVHKKGVKDGNVG